MIWTLQLPVPSIIVAQGSLRRLLSNKTRRESYWKAHVSSDKLELRCFRLEETDFLSSWSCISVTGIYH